MITVDVSNFFLFNVIDACSVWNILSSKRLYAATRSAKVVFCCTKFVHYECLHKSRKQEKTQEDIVLQNRLRQEISMGAFQAYELSIEDLQDFEALNNRKRLGKGELSSIIFTKKTRQAFLTDDRKAKKLAEEILDKKMAQTTPHVFGWLYFINQLADSDKDEIIEEHKKFNRPLAVHFETMYEEALRCRSMENYHGSEAISS